MSEVNPMESLNDDLQIKLNQMRMDNMVALQENQQIIIATVKKMMELIETLAAQIDLHIDGVVSDD